MAPNDLPGLDLPQSPPDQRRAAVRLSVNGKRIGRPPKAQGKRSVDLARYIEAMFAGSTPGQQAAQLCMVSPSEVTAAKKAAAQLGIDGAGLDPFTLAMVVKADRLATALGIRRADAWAALHKERVELMPYIHQRRPQATDDKGKGPVLGYMIPDDQAGAAGQAQLPDYSLDDDDDAIEIVGENPGDPA